MRTLANHHAHSNFSDGKGEVTEFVKQAIRKNMSVHGFSDHAPISIPEISAMDVRSLHNYTSVTDQLRQDYADKIQIYRGLEVDFIPGIIDVSSDYILSCNLDYTIGAVHYVEAYPNGIPWTFESTRERFDHGIQVIFGGDVQKAISRYYDLIRQMVREKPPHVVAHLDRIKKHNTENRYFSETDVWYRQKVYQTLVDIAKAGCILEVNTKGYYRGEVMETYPSRWILEKAWQLRIPVHLASDAHYPEDILGGFEFASQMLRQIGYKSTRILLDGQWQESPLAVTLNPLSTGSEIASQS